MSEKLAYAIPEAAAALGVSRAFLYEFIKAKTLPIVKVGNRTLIRAEDLKQFLDERLVA